MMLHKIKPVSGGITVYDTVTPNGGIHDLLFLKSHVFLVKIITDDKLFSFI